MPANQISFFSAVTAFSAVWKSGYASVQFSPVARPVAPERTWITFAGPPLPCHGGIDAVTVASTLRWDEPPAATATIFTDISVPVGRYMGGMYSILSPSVAP